MMHPDFIIQLAREDNDRRAARALLAHEYDSVTQRSAWWARLLHRG